METNKWSPWWRVLELLAVVFNLLYTLLYLQQNSWCFLFGIVGPALLFALCIRTKIYADAGLQLVYAALAAYGWLHSANQWSEQHWTLQAHLLVLLIGIAVWLIVWQILKFKTDGSSPLLDSFCSVFALVGTVLMINFVHENWLYFIAVNAVSIVLYFNRKLYLATLMFALYLLMAIDGYFLLGIFAL